MKLAMNDQFLQHSRLEHLTSGFALMDPLMLWKLSAQAFVHMIVLHVDDFERIVSTQSTRVMASLKLGTVQ